MKNLIPTSPQLRICLMFALLGVEANPPIQRVLELGVAPRLLELSQQMSTPQLQFETLSFGECFGISVVPSGND